MVLVIDGHNPAQRTHSIEKLCQDLGVDAHVVNSVAQAQAHLVVGPQLVLLHCGDQPDAVEALNKLQNEFIVGYYGGWNPNAAAAAYFASNRSQNHGLIPESVELGLELGSDAAEKLKNCLQLILQQRKRPPEAIEAVYGDPELEAILDKLYTKLAAIQPPGSLDDVRKLRDEELGAYHKNKRGW